MFMHSNVEEFPQAFPLEDISFQTDDDVKFLPEIHVMSVPSATGQVKRVPDILKSIITEQGQIQGTEKSDLSDIGKFDKLGMDTAIVLPDESLLVPLLNTIPPEIDSLNVTMGYPMSGSEVYSLMKSIMAMQLHLRKKGGEWYFYHKQVWEVLSSGLFMALGGEEGKKLSANIKDAAKYYIPVEEFGGFPLASMIFRPVVEDAQSPDASQIRRVEEYQLAILAEVGRLLSGIESMAMEVQFAKRYYQAVNQLKSIDLAILPATYGRLLQRLVGSITVPFCGEPLKGLQVMGPLEMRALDFTNIIVLSCNEGVFPRKSVSSSFIPPELRKGFGLPTYENQDAVWAYYFYRMIQRPSRVWLLYDSRTEGVKSGEESRYIKQLEFQYKYSHLDRDTVSYSMKPAQEEEFIPKTEEDIERIHSLVYSASSLRNYLTCPAKFYYYSVKKLKTLNEVAESLDSAMLGTVFHNTMFALYTGGEALAPDFDMDREHVKEAIPSPLTSISADYIKGLLREEKSIIRPKVRALVESQMNSIEVSGRNLVLEAIINKYVRRTLETDLSLMEENGTDSFRILGLELERYWKFNGHRFIGYIDRMDSFKKGTVRIVDYKTGRAEAKSVNVDSSKAEAMAEALFAPDAKDRPEIALQLFIYDMCTSDMTKGMEVENVVYPVPRLFTSPVLSSAACPEFETAVKEKLTALFEELVDPEVGFRRTSDLEECRKCDFRRICGRKIPKPTF